MSDIVLSASVRQNLLSLQSTADLLSTTQNRLATGNKVNSALDNPTNFFTAQGLNNRASDINNLLDSIGNGVQVLQAANTGITSIQKLVDTAKSIANQALQTPTGYSTKSEASATITGATASNLLGGTATAAVAASTVAASAYTGNEFIAGSKLGSPTTDDSISIDGHTVTFDGTTDGTTAIADGTTFKYTAAEAVAKINHDLGAASSTVTAAVGTGANAGKIVLTNSATGASSNFTVDASGTTAGDGGFGGTAVTTTNGANAGSTGGLSGTTLSIAASSDGAIPAATINFGTGSGQVSTLDQLNTALATSNLTASVDSTGKITITTTNDHASATIGVLSGTATGSGLFTAGAGSTPVADANSQNTRTSLIAQYNQVIDQIKTTAQDSSFNGVNLLNGDQLKLVFNETGKSTLTIQGVTFDPAGLGLSSLVKGTDFLDNSNINTVLNSLNDASSTLRSQASAFGSNLSIVQIRQDFSKNLINVLQTGSSNLTLADTNEEAANSQALATRQSIAVSALALANQSQQSVLQLLR
ncbi:flagellin [Nitrobacter sp.]|uniref:flagellin N-terminal helical domain-containing protein n=1 Tax=Nitrobacter sp. TaxID=29420 RepID=UPI003F652967